MIVILLLKGSNILIEKEIFSIKDPEKLGLEKFQKRSTNFKPSKRFYTYLQREERYYHGLQIIRKS